MGCGLQSCATAGGTGESPGCNQGVLDQLNAHLVILVLSSQQG
jgi:hypothetical protein